MNIFYKFFFLIFNLYILSNCIIPISFEKFENSLIEANLNLSEQNLSYILTPNIPKITINYSNTNHSLIIDFNSTESWLIEKENNIKSISKQPFDFGMKECIDGESIIDPHFSNLQISNIKHFLNFTFYNTINLNLNISSLCKFDNINSNINFDGIITNNQLVKWYINDTLIEKFILNFLNISDAKIEFDEFNKTEFINISNDEPNNITIDYILFGGKNDFYLAKELNKLGLIDSLSYYTIVPYSLIDYFLENYFNSKDECVQENISYSGLHYISCNKKKINIHTINQKVIFIINKFGFELSNLFDDKFYFNQTKEKNDIIFFNILFRENSTKIVFGNNFLLNKSIGYDGKSIYLFSNDILNFTIYYNKWNDTEKKILYSITFLIFILFIIILYVIDTIKKRKMRQNFENQMVNSILNEKE